MTDAPGPQVPASELARRLDRGERVQLLDVRAPEHVALGRVELGAALEFRARPSSQLYALPSLDPLGLDPGEPVLVICGHGNSSTGAAAFLRGRGFDAHSVAGGMAAWEAVYLPRRLAPTRAFEHIVQLDRVAKGALSYALVSDGDAIVVDPGRHIDRYATILEELRATPAAVVDTHMHADYVSGARAAARQWRVPYFLHPDDARSPYDAVEGRFTYEPLRAGDTIACGRATLRAEHVPGHTLGSLTLIADDSLALTGDFLFVQSVGRPDLGERAGEWGRLLWHSLDDARRRWPGDLLVLPAHYASEVERRADRTVGARLDVVIATNRGAGVADEAAFLRFLARHEAPPPERYRTIKLANLGLVQLSDADVEALEVGANQCAVPSV